MTDRRIRRPPGGNEGHEGHEGGRHIVLTGATRGLGRALAERFANLGHRVAGCGRDGGACATLAGRLGAPHTFDRLDVTDEIAVNAWAARVLEHGTPDLVINNAALINRQAKLWEISGDELSAIVDVNIKGVVHVIRAFVPAMIEAGRGVVVNMSSGWGHATAPHVAPYCATKFAIEGLTRAMAEELPPGLAAVPLSPGIINTDMLQVAFGEEANAYPDAATWVEVAAPYILGLGPNDNGRSQRIPVP